MPREELDPIASAKRWLNRAERDDLYNSSVRSALIGLLTLEIAKWERDAARTD